MGTENAKLTEFVQLEKKAQDMSDCKQVELNLWPIK